MPELDGSEATAAIRRLQSDTSRTPIIAVTANAMKTTARHASRRG